MALMLRLRSAGIHSRSVLEAVESVPRDAFVPPQHLAVTYAPRSVPLSCGQSMPSADQVVALIDRLNLTPVHSVLEIGTGSGYQTALMAKLCKKLQTVERYRGLVESAKSIFERLDLKNITVRQADGRDGLTGEGLFDRIIINGAVPALPRQFLDQLASGGMLITALGEPGEEQMLVQLTKVGSRFDRQNLFPVRMQPLVPGIAKAL